MPEGTEHPDGDAAIELVEAAGLHLDPWQERVLRASLLRRDGRWAAFEVGLVCPRQNGKNGLLEARELAGLFVLGEQLIVHSAHLADTAKMGFRRLEMLIASSDWLSREVCHVWRTNGHEAIELRSGQQIRFRTRTSGGGRGFSADCVIFDEAMVYSEAAQTAIMPVVSASPDPQLWYTGSSVDQLVHDDGRILAGVRERALRQDDPSLAYFEWSVPGFSNPDEVPDEIAADPDAWAQSNPAFGIRVTEDYISKERRAFTNNPRGFAVERLGVGDWPALDGSNSPIDLDKWKALEDGESRMLDPLMFAFDVSPDRVWASVAAAGYRSDGLFHVEVVKDGRRRGTGWVVDFLAELAEKHKHLGFLCDAIGPAGTLIHQLEEKRVKVLPVNSGEHALACGLLLDSVDQSKLRHLGTAELEAAIRGAEKRPMVDKWAWARRSSAVDISPLVACTLALWGLSSMNAPPKEPMIAWV